jgi:hypothetical protein
MLIKWENQSEKKKVKTGFFDQKTASYKETKKQFPQHGGSLSFLKTIS